MTINLIIYGEHLQHEASDNTSDANEQVTDDEAYVCSTRLVEKERSWVHDRRNGPSVEGGVNGGGGGVVEWRECIGV